MVVLAVVAAIAGAAALVWQQHRQAEQLRAQVPPAPAPITYSPAAAAAGDDGAAPTPAGVAARLDGALHNPDLGDFTGIITDPSTGTVLWQQDAARPRTPASTTKVLTAAAALLTLPVNGRIATTVVAGTAPGQVVLVGAGDPTLSAAAPGAPSLFTDPPRISELATQLRAGGTRVTSILVDTGLYTGPDMARGWDDADIAGGDITPISPLIADSGRIRPDEDYSPRVPDPALAAGRALAAGLGLPPTAVSAGAAPAGAAQLAKVTSQPLQTRLRDALVHSDNVLAETIGREVALATGQPASFDGAARAVLDVLRGAGFDTTGVRLQDTSGLSVDDRIPARLLDDVLTGAAGSEQPKLRPLLDLLPVGGATGTLTDRYTTVNRPGAGYVRAKTGTLSGVSTLAGFVLDEQGRVLTFTLMTSGTDVNLARPAMDAVAAALRGCGCQ